MLPQPVIILIKDFWPKYGFLIETFDRSFSNIWIFGKILFLLFFGFFRNLNLLKKMLD